MITRVLWKCGEVYTPVLTLLYKICHRLYISSECSNEIQIAAIAHMIHMSACRKTILKANLVKDVSNADEL